ncbi:MAG: FAD-dependent oxidoreductase [Patescibacteria group bacterium]
MIAIYDLIIIGAGAAGCSSAIYATRYALKTLLIAGAMPGGLITEALEVENYPGFLNIKGIDLANNFLGHAKALGVEYLPDTVVSIKKNYSPSKQSFLTTTSPGKIFESKAVILAMGTNHRKLNIPGEKEFEGKGVSYCATCDAPFFKNKTVAVIGGGNSAVEGAQDVAVHASKVYLIYRSELKADPLYIENLKENKKIVEIANTNILKIGGKKSVQYVQLDKEYNGGNNLSVDGVFVQAGYIPANELAKSLGCELTSYGFVKVNAAMQTSLPEIFCAGDLNNGSNQMHQQVTSASEGAIAAQGVFRHLRGMKTVIKS